jgi:hypothetical protein
MLADVLLWIVLKILKEEEDMVVIYCTLILKGKKSVKDVPVRIRKDVIEMLIELESPEELYADYIDENGNVVVE